MWRHGGADVRGTPAAGSRTNFPRTPGVAAPLGVTFPAVTPDWTDILFVVAGLIGVVVLVSTRRGVQGQQAADRLAVGRRRIGGAGAVCVGLLGGLSLADQYGPAPWHGVLFGLMVAVLAALMGHVIAAIVLSVRAERAEPARTDADDRVDALH